MVADRAAAGPLRVGHVTLGLETGGQERLLLEFARHAAGDRVALTVVSLTGRGRLGGQLEALGARVIGLDVPAGFRPRLIMELRKLFRAEDFDVVHTHDERPLIYGGPAALLAGVPVRVHTHHHGRLGPVSRLGRGLLRAAALTVFPFCCVSSDSATYVRDLGVSPGRLLTVLNGIDLSRFPFCGPTRGGPAVCVGRLDPGKGHATLFEAVRAVVATVPNFQLLVAGQGQQAAELERLRVAYGLERNVTLLGEVSDIPGLMARAGLFVLASRSEGISLTILEAMASGLPVVTTAVGGTPEIIANGLSGLLVPRDDPKALADALLTVETDFEIAERLGRAARARVEAAFDVVEMVARYEAFYRALFDGRVRQVSDLPA